MKDLRLLVVVLLPLAVGGSGAPGQAADPPFTVVMSGLDNPRGLALGHDALYVAEGGKGGEGPCVTTPPPRNEVICFGATGAISRLRNGRQKRVVTGLPSLGPVGGQAAGGPQDVVVLDDGKLMATIGLGANPALRAAFPSDILASLIRINEHSGRWHKVADIGDFEAAENPDGGPPDTNPFGLLKHGGRVLADAGGNALLRVAHGEVSTLATFPSRAQGRNTDAVPTGVARGPDGALYVGELTGAPFAVGAARIYRITPGAPPAIFLEGFTTVIDIAFGPDGNLYVLQFATGPGLSGPGALIQVKPDGTRTTIASEGLVAPTSVVIAHAAGHDDDDDCDHDDDGHGHQPAHARTLTFYVSNCGNCSPGGQVVRIER
jgi:hypothetical protein